MNFWQNLSSKRDSNSSVIIMRRQVADTFNLFYLHKQLLMIHVVKTSLHNRGNAISEILESQAII